MFSSIETTAAARLRGFSARRRRCRFDEPCQEASRDVAVRREYQKCTRAVPACCSCRRHKNAICRRFIEAMRMGGGIADSVLDPSCEARAVKRLFIADNSALPNSLGGPNPTLTTQALATRTAETIFRRYFGGHAYVRNGHPVRSIDHRVTRAVLKRKL